MLIDAKHKLFLSLTTTFCTCLLVGDLIGGKLVSGQILGLTFTTTVGMIPFPVTFLLTDLLNEFYGKRAARLVTYLGFFMALLTFALVLIAAEVPIAELTRAPDWQGVTEASFQNVFVGSLRMLAASLVAYLTAQLVDIAVFAALKRMTQGRRLWLRATGSTVVSQAIDTLVITFVAWSGLLPWNEMVRVIFSAYSLKLLIAIGLTPLVYGLHGLIQRQLGIFPFEESASA
jgi:queuosine precursor transporter